MKNCTEDVSNDYNANNVSCSQVGTINGNVAVECTIDVNFTMKCVEPSDDRMIKILRQLRAQISILELEMHSIMEKWKKDSEREKSKCSGVCGLPSIQNGQVDCPTKGTCDPAHCECHVFGGPPGEEMKDLGVGPVKEDPTYLYVCKCVGK